MPLPYLPCPSRTRPTAIVTYPSAARRTSHASRPPTAAAASTPQGVGAEPAPAKAGGLPCLFRAPPPQLFFPIWRLFPGCFARHSIRSCAARFQPAFATQPPSCAAFWPPRTTVPIQAAPSPAAMQPRVNLKAAPSIPGPWRAVPRHGRPGKKREERHESNPIACDKLRVQGLPCPCPCRHAVTLPWRTPPLPLH